MDKREGDEHRSEGTGDGPEQRIGAAGSTGTGLVVGEVVGEVVVAVGVGAKTIE